MVTDWRDGNPEGSCRAVVDEIPSVGKVNVGGFVGEERYCEEWLLGGGRGAEKGGSL